MARGTPLWRIVFSLIVLIFAIQRGFTAVVLGLSGIQAWVVALYAVQAVALLFLWVALRWFGYLVIPAVFTAGGIFAATVMAGMAWDAIPRDVALAQFTMALIATVAFAVLLKTGLVDDQRAGRH